MAEPKDVEILVHIAAPSRAADDAQYRSLASAYLSFEPQRRVALDLSNAPVNDTDAQERQQGPNANENRDTEDASASSPVLFRSTGLSQASFRSVLDSATSLLNFRQAAPAPAATQHQCQQGPTSQDSWQSLPSTVYDSIPENDVSASLFTTPTRVLENYLQQFSSQAGSAQSTSQPTDIRKASELQAAKVVVASDSSLRANGRQVAPTIPCTPGNRPLPVSSVELGEHFGSAPMDGAAQARLNQSQSFVPPDEIIEESIIHTGDTSSGNRSKSEPPLSKRRRIQQPQDGPQAILRTSSDVVYQHTPAEVGRTITFLPDHGYNYESLELHAPEPPASTAPICLTDLITPTMEKLASDVNIEKRYRPEKQIRDLRPFERGCWSVDCAGWPQDLKRQMWAWLANYIGMRQAGWGVWCKRDEDFSRIKAYCWGGVVGHMYLVLWLASRREVLFTDASWIDGEGLPVIIMLKRKRA